MKRAELKRRLRSLREHRATGWIVRLIDRVWWARTIRRSGLVDGEYYAAQLGLRRLPVGFATAHYVVNGFRRGLSVNPLFDEVTAGGHLPEVFRVPAMYAYLLSDRATVPVHPLWDAPGYARTTQTDGLGPLEHVWTHRADTEMLVGIAGVESRRTAASFRAMALRSIRDWRNPRSDADESRSRNAEVVTIVRVIQKRDRRYARKLAQAARFAQRGDTNVVIAMISPDASQWAVARMLGLVNPSLRVIGHRERARWDEIVLAAAERSQARLLAVLDARAEFDDAQVDALLDAAQNGHVAAPVHLRMDGTIAAAGAGFITGMDTPYRILRDHPREDLLGWEADPVSVPLHTGRSWAAPLADILDPLRRIVGHGPADATAALTALARSNGTGSVVLPTMTVVLEEPEYAFRTRRPTRGRLTRASGSRDDTARVEDLLSRSSFDVERWRDEPGRGPRPVLAWRRPSPEAQRWAIKICAPPGRAGAVWGDTHFAVGLARALRRLGHTVVIDAYGASRRSSAYLDDVSVVVRGPYRIVPPDTGTRIEWIISHPDEITAGEVGDFDLVYAASRRWATRASDRFGVRVDPLLECTDADQFRPAGLHRSDDIVFVGTARGIPRPSVVAPLAAGIPVRVYGPDWRPFIPSSAVAAESIPNSALPARYETASVVLNDQWPAMRENGFIAMRPFDVVAVGGRVISEEVDEIEEIFRGAVVAYRDAAHLVELLRADPADIFPPDHEIRRIAAHVREVHSFDARAAVLVAAAADRTEGAAARPVD